MDMDNRVSVAELARITGLATHSIYRMLWRGAIPGAVRQKRGRRASWIIPREAVASLQTVLAIERVRAKKFVQGGDVTLINTTPHDITIHGMNDQVLVVPRSDFTVRLEESREEVGTLVVDGVRVPVYRHTYGAANLPERRPGVIYIVSAMVAEAYPDREDFLVPGRAVRDQEGKVVGCQGLAL